MWAQILSAVVGAWLMLAPAALGYGGTAAVADRIAGPLALTFGVVAASEVTRGVRRANLAVGLWLIAAPWLLHAPAAAAASDCLSGALLAGLSFVGGRVRTRFGGGWAALRPGGAGKGTGE